MYTEEIINRLYDVLLQSYPDIEDRTLEMELAPYLYQDGRSGAGNLYNTRTALDALANHLATLPLERWPEIISYLAPKRRFCFLDRLFFAYNTLRNFRLFEMKARQPEFWQADKLLADIMTNHYRREVILRCLSDGSGPYCFRYFYGEDSLRRY